MVTVHLGNYSLSEKDAVVLTLSGDSYIPYNSVEEPENEVIKQTTLPVDNNFDFTFPAHSITAIQIKVK